MPRKKKEDINSVFVPSKYQEAIFDFVKNGNGNAVIEAVAGSGKTTTALKCLECVGKEDKILLTAFNTDIVEEIKKKVKKLENKDNIDCRTMHSLGYMILMSNYPRKIEPKPNDFKYSGYIYNNISELSGNYYFSLSAKDKSKYIDNIKRFVDFGRYYLCENVKDLEFIESHYHIPTFKDEKEIALRVMEWGKENYQTIDFTDMIWLPNVLNCKPYNRLYDWIICDECQDTMTAERMLLLKCTKMSTRMLFFGEKIQCQPEGTQVLMSDGTTRNIKDLKVGDEVVTYNQKKGTYSGYKGSIRDNKCIVTGIESHVDNRFVKITTENGLSSIYTPEHVCLAKFNFGDRHIVWGVAMMENDMGMFFIGKALLYCHKFHKGLLHTMRSEYCSRGWLLEICYTESDATLAQLRISQLYNVPLAPSMLFGENIKEMVGINLRPLYDDMGGNKIFENAMKCLKTYKRFPNYPISDAHNQIPHARTLLHTVRACNLMPEIMEVSYFDINNKSKKVRDSYRYSASIIKEVEYINEERMVYSLNVSKNHTYVADGIATHNCIYSFMGSDYRSFDELRRLPNTISLPLSITYRCSKNVVDHVKKFNERIEAKEGAIDGSVRFDCSIDDINAGDMVLCRNNAPLMQLYCELAKIGKTAYIRGKDVGSNLVKIITRTKQDKLNKNLKKKGVFSVLYNSLINDIDTIMQKYHVTLEMAMEDSAVSQQLDVIQALDAISEEMTTTNELVDKIKSLFSDKKMEGISLSTIHKAKGLEADNVFICCPSLLPSKTAKEDWEKEQEYNLEYVAYTRAKNNLSFLDESKFESFSTNSQQRMSDFSDIMRKVFSIHGGSDRCQLEQPCHEAAKMILSNKTEITNKPRNAIELVSCGNQPRRNQLTGMTRKKLKRR